MSQPSIPLDPKCSVTKRIYVARQVTIFDNLHDRVDDEAVFDSYELAFAFLTELSKDYPPEYLPDYRNEIIEYELNCNTPWTNLRKWTFTVDGRLHFSTDSRSSAKRDWDVKHFSNLFDIGQIVLIKGNLDCPESPFTSDTYGVIMGRPVEKGIWLSSGMSEVDWEGDYVVGHIDGYGFFDHVHLPERCLTESTSNCLPEKLAFLNNASDYFNGKLPDAKTERALRGELLVLNVPIFFSNQTNCS